MYYLYVYIVSIINCLKQPAVGCMLHVESSSAESAKKRKKNLVALNKNIIHYHNKISSDQTLRTTGCGYINPTSKPRIAPHITCLGVWPSTSFNFRSLTGCPSNKSSTTAFNTCA